MIHLDVQNQSAVKRLHRRQTLTALAERVCRGENMRDEAELSLLFCDDPFIRALNNQYRGIDEPTDVLAFQQEGPTHSGKRVLGDIVISLETVQRACRGDRAAMRDEMHLLFCHGLLHLLGYAHKKSVDKEAMQRQQARYLDSTLESAWH